MCASYTYICAHQESESHFQAANSGCGQQYKHLKQAIQSATVQCRNTETHWMNTECFWKAFHLNIFLLHTNHLSESFVCTIPLQGTLAFSSGCQKILETSFQTALMQVRLRTNLITHISAPILAQKKRTCIMTPRTPLRKLWPSRTFETVTAAREISAESDTIAFVSCKQRAPSASQSLSKCKWWKSRLRRNTLALKVSGNGQHQRQPPQQMRQVTWGKIQSVFSAPWCRRYKWLPLIQSGPRLSIWF